VFAGKTHSQAVFATPPHQQQHAAQSHNAIVPEQRRVPRIAGAYGDHGITQAKRGNVDQHLRHGFLAHANDLLWFVHDFDVTWVLY
tara:strand:+ start:163 stop:420 length:258 start_codon:yes stop_codon:yes gene_type:complete